MMGLHDLIINEIVVESASLLAFEGALLADATMRVERRLEQLVESESTQSFFCNQHTRCNESTIAEWLGDDESAIRETTTTTSGRPSAGRRSHQICGATEDEAARAERAGGRPGERVSE